MGNRQKCITVESNFYSMPMNYFCITVHLYNKKEPLRGIRGYATFDTMTVHKIAMKELLKKYPKTDIMKVDVWPMTEDSEEVKAYKSKHQLD